MIGYPKNQSENQFNTPFEMAQDSKGSTATETVSPISLFFTVSGLYAWQSPRAAEKSEPAQPIQACTMQDASYEIIHLDVDGLHPKMTASGVLKDGSHIVYWLAQLEASNEDTWSGKIYDMKGEVEAFPYTAIQITVIRSMFSNMRELNIVFRGEDGAERHNTLKYETPLYSLNFAQMQAS